MKDEGFFRSINHGSYWYKADPFILSTQATKVFYLKDNKHADDSKITESWRIVQKFCHRHLWDVAEKDNDEIPDGPCLSYQDEASEGFQVELNAGNLDTEQQDDEGILEDEDCVQVDASVVDNLRRKWKKKTKHGENDETLWQYVSDNEGPTSLDDDDDSDVD